MYAQYLIRCNHCGNTPTINRSVDSGSTSDLLICQCGLSMSAIDELNLVLRWNSRCFDYGFPNQPIGQDEHGTVRFKQNKMVDKVLEDMTKLRIYDMNRIYADFFMRKSFSGEELMHFHQLIGYSLSGYGDLSQNSLSEVDRVDKILSTYTEYPSLDSVEQPFMPIAKFTNEREEGIRFVGNRLVQKLFDTAMDNCGEHVNTTYVLRLARENKFEEQDIAQTLQLLGVPLESYLNFPLISERLKKWPKLVKKMIKMD